MEVMAMTYKYSMTTETTRRAHFDFLVMRKVIYIFLSHFSFFFFWFNILKIVANELEPFLLI